MAKQKIRPEVLDYPSHEEHPDHSTRNKAEFIEHAFYWLVHPDHENSIKHLYLDSKGIVTTGVGHAIKQQDAVKKLPFFFRNPPSPPRDVTDDDKIEEYKKVKALLIQLTKEGRRIPPGNSSYFRKETNLDLKEDAIRDLFEEDIKYFLRELERKFPHYNKYPDEAKLGLLDMAYNLGPPGFISKFPNLVRAAKMGDWITVAEECHRRDIGEKRNNDTKDLFERAAKAIETKDASPAVPRLLNIDPIQNNERQFPDVWA